MPFIIRHFIALYLLLSCFQASAQFDDSYNFTFKSYTTSDGLAHNYTRRCKADSKGFLWIATENGLSRFDGYQFTNFFHDPKDSNSLPENNLWDVDIDKYDRIWIAYESGVCFYNPATQRFTTIKGLETKHLVNTLVVDKFRPIVWIASAEGLLKVDIHTLKIFTTKINTPFRNDVTHLMLDSRKRLWITIIRRGYYMYDTVADTAHYYDNPCWPMHTYEDSKHDTWISTWQHGLQRFDNATGANNKETYQQPYEDGYSQIYGSATECPTVTGNDILWVASRGGGIVLFDKKVRRFVKWFRYQPATKSGISTDLNNYIYTSPDGTLWICSSLGLEKVNKCEQQFQSAELPHLNSRLWNLLSGLQYDPVNKDIIWMALNGGGIAKYSRSKEQIIASYYKTSRDTTKDEHYLQRWPNCFFKDSNSTIWGTTYGGVIKIKNAAISFINIKDDSGYHSYSNVGFQDKNGTLWGMGVGGLFWFNPYTLQNRFYRLPMRPNSIPFANMFSGMAQGPSGELYVASWNGVYRFTDFAIDTALIPYSQSLPNSERWENCVALECIDNCLFIGTSKGLLEYNTQNNTVKRIGDETNINFLTFNSLKKDSFQNLWIYTISGVYRYNPQKRELKKFTSEDGIYLTSSETPAFFMFNDYLYIGQRMAYTRFKPNETGINNSLAVPYITGLQIGKENLKAAADSFINQQLLLTYEQNSLLFSFTGIEYNSPQKIKLEYMLHGFDKTWKQSSASRNAQYTNLAEGNYTFMVRAINSAGLINNTTAIFKVYISPPWWRTWWWRSLFLIMIVVAVYTWLRIRINKIKNIEAQKTAINKSIAESEMAALRSQMNPHFIFNALNSINRYILTADTDKASDYLIRFSRLIRLVLENSKASKVPLTADLEALQLYIAMEKMRFGETFTSHIEVDKNIDQQYVLLPPLLMQPYVENAIWHGLMQKEKGDKMLIIHIAQPADNVLLITITDNGIGRQKAAELKSKSAMNGRSFGMQITQDRIGIVNKLINIQTSVTIEDVIDDNGVGAGTKVSLQVSV